MLYQGGQVGNGDVLDGLEHINRSRDTVSDIVSRHPSNLEDVSEVDCRRGQAVRCAMMGKCVLESVTRRVVGLRCVSQNSGKRRQHDEEIELVTRAKMAVEVDRTGDFGSQRASVVIERHFWEYGVLLACQRKVKDDDRKKRKLTRRTIPQ